MNSKKELFKHEQDLEQEIYNSKKELLLFFNSKINFNMIDLALECRNLINELGKDTHLFVINIEDYPRLTDLFSVDMTPTFISFKNSAIAGRYVGWPEKDHLMALIK